MTQLTPAEHQAVLSDAYLAYRREVAGWSPGDSTTCRCEQCAPSERPAHRGTDGWRAAMFKRHRSHRRGKR